MNPALDLDLKQGDDRAYNALAQAAKDSLVTLLTNVSTVLRLKNIKAFPSHFIIEIERYVRASCCDSVEIIERCRFDPALRGRAGKALFEEIRKEVFEPLDRPVGGL